MEESDQEFLRALHEEKIRTQDERAELATNKLTFIAVLFGLSSVNIGIDIANLYWLLYLVPLVAISYDLYIMSADSRIKRIGVFLGQSPSSVAGEAEREWERFSTMHKDGLGPSANMFVSVIVTVGASIFVRSQRMCPQGPTKLFFAFWMVGSLSAIIALWIQHKMLVCRIENPTIVKENGTSL